MKKLLVFLFVFVSLFSEAQLKISDMPTYVGAGDSAYVPIVIGGVNRKIYGKELSRSKVDSVWISAGYLYYRRYGISYLAGPVGSSVSSPMAGSGIGLSGDYINFGGVLTQDATITGRNYNVGFGTSLVRTNAFNAYTRSGVYLQDTALSGTAPYLQLLGGNASLYGKKTTITGVDSIVMAGLVNTLDTNFHKIVVRHKSSGRLAEAYWPTTGSGTYSSVNGITLSGSAFELGGALTKNTIFSNRNFGFDFGTSANRLNQFNVYTRGGIYLADSLYGGAVANYLQITNGNQNILTKVFSLSATQDMRVGATDIVEITAGDSLTLQITGTADLADTNVYKPLYKHTSSGKVLPGPYMGGAGGAGLDSLLFRTPLKVSAVGDTVYIKEASYVDSGYITPAMKLAYDNKQDTLILTTTGTSGAATFNPGTNTLNIPQYTGGGGVGDVVLISSTDVTGVNTTDVDFSTTLVIYKYIEVRFINVVAALDANYLRVRLSPDAVTYNAGATDYNQSSLDLAVGGTASNPPSADHVEVMGRMEGTDYAHELSVIVRHPANATAKPMISFTAEHFGWDGAFGNRKGIAYLNTPQVTQALRIYSDQNFSGTIQIWGYK